MNYKELKDEIKQEKRNYYDKNIMKRLFIKTPNLKIYKIIIFGDCYDSKAKNGTGVDL